MLNIISECQPDQIFHLAAQSYPTVSWTNPQATIDTNVNGTINVYEVIKAVREKNMSSNECERMYVEAVDKNAKVAS